MTSIQLQPLVPTLLALCIAGNGNMILAADLPDDLATCQAIADRGARLRCYDELGRGSPTLQGFPGDTAEMAPALPVIISRQQPVVPARTAVQRDAADEVEVLAHISGLEQFMPSQWLVTLDNGQQWRQTDPKAFRLREGQEVRIKPSGWGVGYRLSVAELGGFIQVEPVR